MKLSFLGATGTVTGSKYLLEANNKKILIDCGLFQGFRGLRRRNWDELPVSPRDIDAVILTHAHIDHSGYVPLLIKNGFKGKVFCSQATKDLCSILLPDSGHIQEEDAKRANKHGYSRHKQAVPLYTREEAVAAIEYFYPVPFGQDYELFDDVIFQLNRAGHILGSSFVTITSEDKRIVFSGDIGRTHDPVIKPPAVIQAANYLVLESTYGDRLHDTHDVAGQLEKIINRTIQRNGTVVIPAFAVGRAQALLYYIYQLKKEKRIADVPVYLDSPLAINATNIFHHHANEHTLSQDLCNKVCNVAKYVNTQEQSKELDTITTPKIIISASGMATGGRVLHHLKVFLPDPNNTILLTGYQAEGTRGDRILKGEKRIKIHGEMFDVNAEIGLLTNISAHADYDEILNWLENFNVPLEKIFIVHGEQRASEALKEKIEARFNWDCVIPEFMQTEVL